MNTSIYTVTTLDGGVHRVRGTVITTESYDGQLLLSIADQSSGDKRTVAIFRSWNYVTFEPDDRHDINTGGKRSATVESAGPLTYLSMAARSGHCCRADA